MRITICTAILLVAMLILAVSAMAGTKANPTITGWEHGGAYDKLYDPKEADTLKGRLTKIIDITPMPGMAPGIGLQIEDKKDKGLEIVHLGPKDFVDLGAFGLKVGDQVKVAGAWAEMDDQDVLIAVKVKKDDDSQLKVRRSKDGFPYWSMSPEERAKESAGE